MPSTSHIGVIWKPSRPSSPSAASISVLVEKRTKRGTLETLSVALAAPRLPLPIQTTPIAASNLLAVDDDGFGAAVCACTPAAHEQTSATAPATRAREKERLISVAL